MATDVDSVIDELIKLVPSRYQASREVLAAFAGPLAVATDWVEENAPISDFEGSYGIWRTLLAKSYGVYRATEETDELLLVRMRNPDERLTPVSILKAVNDILATRTTTQAQLIEFFAIEPNMVLGTEVVAFSFILGRSITEFEPGSFIIILPDFGDINDPIYQSIAAEVNSIRGAGIKSYFLVQGAAA